MARKKALVIDDDEYSVGTEPSVEPPPPPPPPGDKAATVTGKKKGKNENAKAAKGNKGKDDDVAGVAFDAIDDVDNGGGGEVVVVDGGRNKNDDDKDEPVFSNKSSKGGKKGGGALFSAASFGEIDEDDEEDDDASSVAFSGKKKSSKKRSSSLVAKVSDVTGFGSEIVDVVVEAEQPSVGVSNTVAGSNVNKSGGVTEISENKERNKENDNVQPHHKLGSAANANAHADSAGEKEGAEETVESAAGKKKKKKKKKEKEKKVAAAAGSAQENEAKEVKAEPIESKKKVPKHVREMQEELARRKEAEERKKREEEERLMKEEEERRRQEELERQAEEARRQKKEKEKEKLQRRKQEGKLLTGKQKEEARRLEIMRKQFLNSTGGALPTGGSGAPPKRPIYQTKKLKPAHHHDQDSAVEAEENQETTTDEGSGEPEKAEEEEVELHEAAEESGVEEDDVEDEWDAKSWDDVDLNARGAFADEEVDSDPELVVKKEIKTGAATHNAAATKKTVSRPVADETEDRKPSLPREPTKSTLPKETPKSAAPPKLREENLRSPICCVMGHVDAGKTKLMDCIRGTNVQEGEAGGITQQIGATYFPAENIRERTKELKADAKLKVPGLLVIDTPGHKSFTKLRSRGSGLCDIAILVVDIMHGLNQEIEKQLLKPLEERNTEFIIALNKVDRLYGWKTCHNSPIAKAIKQQTKDVQNEFNMRVNQIITQFKERGLNTSLYYKNKEMGKTFSIVPTSAISGEGIPDLLLLLVQWTQKTMVEKLTYREEVKCTVLEVKVLEGHGTTLDVVLVNGVLHEGDWIVICGMQGPIVTTIRALLTPHPMKELRVKGTFLHHKEIKAAMGIKITARGLEHAVAGTGLYVVKPDDDLEDVKEAAMEDMRSVMSGIDINGEGVCVQASSLGSLEALLEFLAQEVKIPVRGISIGPVHKKDVMKASVMLEKKREYATILAFDIKVTPEARELADEMGVKIFVADIIYHLFDKFKAYLDNIQEEEKREAADQTVFPCVLKILPGCIFNKKDPIVLGVDVLEGIAKIGTPICIPSREFIDIGRIASIKNNHNAVDSAKKGQQIAIKIVGSNPGEQHKMYGRHFDIDDELVSHISERSTHNRADMTDDEWNLLMKLKNVFKIQQGGLM